MNLTEMNIGPWQIGLGTQFKELKAEEKDNERTVWRDDLDVCVIKKRERKKMVEVLTIKAPSSMAKNLDLNSAEIISTWEQRRTSHFDK